MQHGKAVFDPQLFKFVAELTGTLAKVLGKGCVDVDIKNIEATNVLLVDGLKDNILSVSQITNKGHAILFTYIGCKIIEEDTGKTIAKRFKILIICAKVESR